jgi:uncharacterized membrane protein YcaP (DUF421 family)
MDLVLRACVIFVFLLVLTRIIGRRELSTLAPFDLILLIIVGDAVQQGLTQDDYSLTGAMIAVGTIAVLQVVVSFTSFRLPPIRNLLEGHPIVIVQDGKPIEKNMRRERLTVEELMEEARQQQVASLDDIQWAVLEPSGNISFIPKKSS